MKRLLVIAAISTAAAIAHADAADPVYNFKLDEPVTGSNVRRLVLSQDSRIALNRPYAQLTEEEKRLVRSQYEPMAPGDEPPYPVDGMLPIYKAVAQASRSMRRAGQGASPWWRPSAQPVMCSRCR